MKDKLKKVIELANQLQEAVNECADDVLSVDIYRSGDTLTSGIHIYNPDPDKFDGMKFSGQDMYGNRWFENRSYGVRLYGAVIGGDDQ